MVPFSFDIDYISIGIDYISIGISSLCSSELVSYCNTIIIKNIVVLVLACLLISLMLILQSGMWKPLQNGRWTQLELYLIRDSMTQVIPRERRRDPLYAKLGYQYASNNLTHPNVLTYDSVWWLLHTPTRNYPKLSFDEDIRVRRAVRSGIDNQDPDSFEYRVNTRVVYLKYDPTKTAVVSSPQLIRLVAKYDPGQ